MSDAVLLSVGTSYNPGPATLVRRGDGFIVLVPGVAKRLIDAAWSVLADAPEADEVLARLAEGAGFDTVADLPAVVFGIVSPQSAKVGIKGKASVAVYTAKERTLVVGGDEPTLDEFADPLRVAFGELPSEDGPGIHVIESGIVRMRGFAHMIADPTVLPEADRTRLGEMVEVEGRVIEDDEAKARRAAAPAPRPRVKVAPPKTPVARTAPAVTAPAPTPQPAVVAPAPVAAPQTEAPNLFADLFSAVPAGPPAATSAVVPPVRTQDVEPAPAPASVPVPAPVSAPEPSAEPVAPSNGSAMASVDAESPQSAPTPRRRLLSSSLFERARAAASEPAARAVSESVPAPVPASESEALPAPARDAAADGAPQAEPEPRPETEPELQPEPEPELESDRASDPDDPAAPDSIADRTMVFEDLSYDDLFGATLHRRIQDAAVRPGSEPPAEARPDAPASPTPQEGAEEASDPEPEHEAEPTALPAPARVEFIDWVPGMGRPTASPQRPATPIATPSEASPGTPPSMKSSAASAPTAPAQSGPPADGSGAVDTGIEDTIAIPRRTPSSQSPSAPTAQSATSSRTPVLIAAQVCPSGHASSPERAACRVCGTALDGTVVSVPRPALGTLEISTGGTVLLERTVILGRRPRASRVSGDDVPMLVTVPSPQQDISRSHLEIRPEGWHVVAVDLGATNGTRLLRRQQGPVRLRPGDPMLLRPDDVLDLGDGVTLRWKETV